MTLLPFFALERFIRTALKISRFATASLGHI